MVFFPVVLLNSLRTFQVRGSKYTVSSMSVNVAVLSSSFLLQCVVHHVVQGGLSFEPVVSLRQKRRLIDRSIGLSFSFLYLHLNKNTREMLFGSPQRTNFYLCTEPPKIAQHFAFQLVPSFTSNQLDR